MLLLVIRYHFSKMRVGCFLISEYSGFEKPPFRNFGTGVPDTETAIDWLDYPASEMEFLSSPKPLAVR